jgi:hypothetical protein
LTSWDALYQPVDIGPKVTFPNIFAHAASNSSIALSSQVVSRTSVTLTLNFNAPFTGRPIFFITVSGVRFSAPLQQQPTKADCHVNIPPVVNVPAASVNFNVDSAQIALVLTQPGLIVGTGSVLPVTCTVSNLVNTPAAGSAVPTASLLTFGVDNSPLHIHNNFQFPEIFQQSLGLNRPRVRWHEHGFACSPT